MARRHRGGCASAVSALALWNLAATAAAAADEAVATTSRKFAVVAYLPDWRYEAANWEEISKVATHLILYGLQPSPDGHIDGMDRLPHGKVLAEAKSAAAKHGTRLLVCFGGDGRSAGFSTMARDKETRERFVAGVAHTIEELGLDGVDYKWEYPGYGAEKGYREDDEVKADYEALGQLLRDTRGALAAGSTLTAAYSPDGRQEELLRDVAQAHKTVDLLHAAAYDQPPPGKHSTFEYASEALARGVAALPAASLTLGLPFHARDVGTGDWRPYEDLVRGLTSVPRDLDEVGGSYFNGQATVARKTALAGDAGLGGVMIWEVGQDCSVAPVVRDGRTRQATCPEGRNSSLLFEVLRAMEGANLRRDEAPPKPKQPDDEL